MDVKDCFAYAYLGHIELISQTMQKLGEEFVRMSNVYIFQTMLGAIGPDLFFGKKKIFNNLHKGKNLIQVPLAMIEYIKTLPIGEKREKLKMFVFAYLSHVAGDLSGDPLCHKISKDMSHKWKFLRASMHFDLYIFMKYNINKGDSINKNIVLYEFDTDVLQLWYQIYNEMFPMESINHKDIILSFDRTKSIIWWMFKEWKYPWIRVMFPYKINGGYLNKFKENFELAKNKSTEFVEATYTFLHSTEWRKGELEKLEDVLLKDNHQLSCEWK